MTQRRSYRLDPAIDRSFKAGKYTRTELTPMTTYQLRELAKKEKVVLSGINPLDKEAIIHTLLRFRGREDALNIDKYIPEGWERLNELLQRVQIKHVVSMANRVPAKITVFETLGLTPTDGCRLMLPGAVQPGNAIMLSEDGEICGIFYLEPVQGAEYSMVQSGEMPVKMANRKNYSLLVFDKRESDIVYSVYHDTVDSYPVQLKCHKLQVLDFEVRQPVETSTTLCIDFGSSNSAVGFFADQHLSDLVGTPYGTRIIEPNTVNLLPTEGPGGRMMPLIPTAVGILDISGGKIEYQFGHEAMYFLSHGYADDTFTLFCDIKRWVSDCERMEEVTDKHGNRQFVARKEILKEYFEYIITLAKRYFKCNFKYLHISCPVKQKYRFQALFEEILGEYQLENENRLDEGAAVLFNTISNLIDNNAFENIEDYKALIIDCGGGTTDLSSCTFRIDNRRVSYKIDIETAYEDGDTDFGGNNLTYRIMQYLKVYWADLIQGNKVDAPVFQDMQMDVYRTVDEQGVRAIYKDLEQRYERAEAILPTKFRLFESSDRSDYFKVKANFYFLFNTAERVKTTFFARGQSIGIYLTCGNNGQPPLGVDILPIDAWKLSRLEGGRLNTIRETPSLLLNAQDIKMLLKPDVYGMIRKFLEPMYDEKQLYDYSIIKLTGQSCKIDLFRAALKEFVPGRIIEFARSGVTEQYELKLACLRGAIQYLNAKKAGYADVQIHSLLSSLPYSVVAYTHTNEETTLIHSKDASRTEGFISRNMERLTLKLYLLDSEGNRRCEYQYLNQPEDFKPVTYEQVLATHQEKIIQDETDNIVDNEVKFFVFAKQELWGFYVVPIYRRDEQLYLGKKEFFPFENDVWETNFFDGMK